MEEVRFHQKVATQFRSWKTKLRRRWLAKKKTKPTVEAIEVEENAVVDLDDDSVNNSESEKSSSRDKENEVHIEGEAGVDTVDSVAKPKEKRPEPWEVYKGTISKEQWELFAKNYRSKEFQAISKKARSSGSKNEHQHRMGQNSYNTSELKWIKSGRLSPPPAPAESSASSATMDSTSVAYRWLRRAKLWLLGQESKLADGSWGIDPINTKTKEIAEKIVRHLNCLIVHF